MNTTAEGMTVASNHTSVEENPWYIAVRSIQTSTLPIVCLAGFIGNILAAGAFLSLPLRKTSCCLYLASKAISDICFLTSLMVVWLYRLDLGVFSTPGVCQTTVFVTYISSFLSVWFVVLITWENFIRVSLPGYVQTLCNVRRAKCTIVTLVTMSFAIYSFSLWTTGLISSNDDSTCLVFEKYEKLLVAMTCVDSVVTLLIPLVIMIFLNVAITINSVQATKRRQRLFQNVSRPRCSRRRTSILEIKVSQLLFAVSTIFIVLHTPSHVIRIKMMVLQNVHYMSPSLSDMILHRLFELIYYMNFSLHIGIYLLFGEKFRLVFRKLYCCSCKHGPSPETNHFVTIAKEETAA